MGPDERRAAAFARWFDEQTCTRIEAWRWGTVFVDAEFPHVSDSNFLSLTDVPADEAPVRVVAEVERVRAEAGIPHRVVVADTELAGRLAPAFERAGWRGDLYRLMVHRREADLPPTALAAGEVSLSALLRFRDELEVETADRHEPLEARRGYAEKIDRAVGTRCFLARAEGRAVSGCVLWTHGDEAQLDAVATLPAFRGRGAAGSAVAAAAEAARVAGASWVHLYTHAGMGPIPLYGRLGFDDAGGVTEFVEA